MLPDYLRLMPAKSTAGDTQWAQRSKNGPNRLPENNWQHIAISTICAPANILEFRHARTTGTKLHRMGKPIDTLETPTISLLIIAC